jgi:5-methylcytosine-specific restriction endonuclease McrA
LKKPTVSSLKKKCWVTFSKYIRLRDCLKTTGSPDYGKCITCGRLVGITSADAGHFISRRFNSTLFNERNVHLQCKQCNAWGGKPLEYRRQIIRLYGEGADTELEDKATEIKKFTPQDLIELTEYYTNKIKELG